MESRVPVPTDSIYKFYALFGLLLIIFSIGAIIYVNQSTNVLVFETTVEYEVLKADPVRTVRQESQFRSLERKLEIAMTNRAILSCSLGLVILAGAVMAWYGFRKWHTKVQPILDEMARLSLKKLKSEVGED